MYRYYMIARPAGPGAQPKDGLVNVIDLDPSKVCPVINKPAYALLEYDRSLSLQEERSYELLPAIWTADIRYRGYVFEWHEWEQLWRVYKAGNPQDTIAYEESVKEAKANIDEYLGTSEKEAKK